MNGAEIAHMLKKLGNVQEALGLEEIFRSGELVGAAKAVLFIGCAIGFCKLSRWGYKKLIECIEERRNMPIQAVGSVQ